jgi:hypothetical protein
MTIEMTEYSFTPADLEFRVGQEVTLLEFRVGQEVTLHLTNTGELEHEIMFGRDVMMTNGRPNGYTVDMFESAGVEPVVTVEKSESGEHKEDEHMEGRHLYNELYGYGRHAR